MSGLVVFFSAEMGRTAKVAGDLAAKQGLDIFDSKPVEPYTRADLNYINPLARCNREKFGKKEVPSEGRIENFSDYDTVYIGFPIWYGAAPNVVNTFCKAYDWTGITVHAFATSGGSGIGRTAEKLKPYVKGAASVDAKLVQSADEI